MTCCSATGVQLLALAAEVGVARACRLMGVHRSTYYRWKREVERAGLEVLRPRERRRPQMPNQLSPLVEQRIVAFALGHPGLGPKRISAQLARPQWGGLLVSANGVYKTLVRHGLNTRAKRLALVAGYRAPYEPPREPEPEPHIDVDRPGQLVGFDCFFVGRLHGSSGPVWQLNRDRLLQLVRLGRSGRLPARRTHRRAHLEARPPRRRRAPGRGLAARARAHRQRRRVRREFAKRLPAGVAHSQIRSGRPQTNGHVERLQRTILEECWRPAFARFLQVRYSGLRRHLASYLDYYNHERAHTGRRTAGRCPADLVYGARKMEPR
jgi:transposase